MGGSCICDGQLLQMACARDGNDGGCFCRNLYLRWTAHLLCLLQLERSGAVAVCAECVRMAVVVKHDALVGEIVVRIGGRPKPGVMRRHGERERLADEKIRRELESLFSDDRAHLCQGSPLAHAQRNRQTPQPLAELILVEVKGELRRTVETISISLHDERVDRAVQSCIEIGQQQPNFVVDGALSVGAFCADSRILRIPVMEQVLCRENIRALTRGLCLPIGGELREKVVVVGTTLCSCEEVVKERRSPLVIAPEHAEIIAHHISFPF